MEAVSTSCQTNWTWIDDGNYPIVVTVVDEERDEVEQSCMQTSLIAH